MELRRRFIFRGNAAAIGGRVVRPSDLIIDSTVTSSLTVVGGRSRERAGPARFGEWVGFASASTSAEGLFDDVQRQIDFTFGKIPEDALTSSTRVNVDVTGLSIGGDKPKLTVKHLHAALNSKSPTGSGEPSIALGSETVIEGAAIDGHLLAIELAVPVFQQHDTRSKLLTAADDPKFVNESGECLYMKQPTPGAVAPTAGRVPYGTGGTIFATIVKSIKWAGDPIAGVTFDQNAVIVPDLGKVFFGELLITSLSRRLTMVRVELGSLIGGVVACGEVETNGAWSN
jgi:hypothetical protein